MLSDETHRLHCLSNVEKDNKGIIFLFCIIKLYYYIENGEENDGTNWTCMQVNKYPSGQIEPIFFDPFGAPPSESIKKFVLDNTGKKLPYTEKDVQSLMNNACGYYCLPSLY